MTEQSKIPLPGEGAKGKSLFERADGAFGLGDLKAAPVPAQLAEPVNRRPVKATTPPAAAERPAPVLPAAAVPLPAAPAAMTVPATAAAAAPAPVEERIEFTGPRQAIDRKRLRANGLIVPDGDVTTLIEEFRIVKRQILLAARDALDAGGGPAAQRVLVSSPLPSEGKTFCATNLALSIGVEKEVEVVLVDADFAKPSIPALLGLSAGGGKAPGLMDAFANPAIRVEDCVIATDIPGFYVLPAGNRTASDSEYLSSGRTVEVLDRLTRGARRRIVIFDSPPALAASPAAELASRVGQALVICRADQTGQSALEDALSLLSACPDIKLLLNSAHFSPSGRRFGAYYGYGG
ncbi:MAG TPA: capsular biosynthesis protein [Croceibacterium sp.]